MLSDGGTFPQNNHRGGLLECVPETFVKESIVKVCDLNPYESSVENTFIN